jgi:RimJ/RimL family protein N-acetyltransferase
MSSATNTTVPLGAVIPNWQAPPRPPRTVLSGHLCRIEPLDAARHGSALWAANALDGEGRNWDYLPYGPFASEADYLNWLGAMSRTEDPLFFAIVDVESGAAVGVASYLRIDPSNGVIEVGHLNFSPKLQRTPLATEAMYLMMRNAFALGYRRYEWKCNALNAPSRRAAQRLGFAYEGTFRQAAVSKGRNRDTAWYSVIDGEWPALRTAFERWLAAENFDADGRQRQSLSDLTAPLLAALG